MSHKALRKAIFCIVFLSWIVVSTSQFNYTCSHQKHECSYFVNVNPDTDTSTEFELQTTSTRCYVDIYIKSHDNVCMSPTYILSYYDHNITIYDQKTKQIKRCHKSSLCSALETCTLNTMPIQSNESSKIALSIQLDDICNYRNSSVSSINPKLSILCSGNTVYIASVSSVIKSIPTIVLSASIMVILCLLYWIIFVVWISKNNTIYYFPMILFINFYARTVLVKFALYPCAPFHISACFSIFEDAWLYQWYLLVWIAFKMIMIGAISIYFKTTFVQEYVHRKENEKPGISKIAEILFVICSIVTDPIIALNLLKIKISMSKRIMMALLKWKLVILLYFIEISANAVIIWVVYFIYNLNMKQYHIETVCFIFCELLILYGHVFGLATAQNLWKQTHSFMEIKCKFDTSEDDEQLSRLSSSYTDYKARLAQKIASYVSKPEYNIEVIRIHANNILMCIAYDISNGDKHISMLEMESFFSEQLTDNKFSMYIKEEISKNANNLPIITIKGQYQVDQIREYQIRKFEENIQREMKDVENMNKEIKSLKSMSSADLSKMIRYWILKDEKQKLYRREMMQIIMEKNINAFTIKKQQRKNIKIAKYLQNIIGDYVNLRMLIQIEEKLEVLQNQNGTAQEIGRLVCMIAVDAIKKVNAAIDGKWIVNNIKNTRFVQELQHVTCLDRDDIIQIYRFLMKYHLNVPDNIQSIIINNLYKQIKINMKIIEDAVGNVYCINYESLMIKLTNNIAVASENAILMNLCDYLVYEAKRDGIEKYRLSEQIYNVIASTFSDNGLNEWWCSECGHHNRVIKIFNKKLKLHHKLLQQCIVCGNDKIESTINTLKGKSNKNLFDTIASLDQSFECKLDATTCPHYDNLLMFMENYSEKESIDCVDVLSKLSYNETINHIILPSINNMQSDEDRLILQKIINDDEKHNLFDESEQFILYLTEKQMQIIFNQNVTVASISQFYTNIIQQIDIFLQEHQRTLFNFSYITATNDWNHVRLFHSNDIQNHCICKTEINCVPTTRYNQTQKKRKNKGINASIPSHLNIDIVQKMLVEQHHQNELDTIHINRFHGNANPKSEHKHIIMVDDTQNKMKRKRKSIPFKRNTENELTQSLLAEHNEFDLVNSVEMIINIDAMEEKQNPMTFTQEDLAEIRNRYTTNISSYGFGTDHRHEELGPHEGNNCLKIELFNTRYISQQIWDEKLIKAFFKYKLINDNDTTYHANRFSDDYNILRGDQIGVCHILSICFYTDCGDLCTQYRSSFRRIETDKNNDSVVHRFRKYYFLSRFIFEAIEFWGETLKEDKILYHGLNKPLLFERFKHHFNAPMSTTPHKHVAANFATEEGIILYLKNGTEGVDESSVITKFKSNQPRYMDVSCFSDFELEDEWLFFGHSIILEIVDIDYVHRPEQIPVGTLKELNLLQRIIKNKEIKWEDETNRVTALANKLMTTRDINKRIMQYDNVNDEIDSLERHMKNDQSIDNVFCSAFYYWYTVNEYDRDSLVEDIGDTADKNQSNFYQFLIAEHKPEYFDTIYVLFSEQKQEGVKQLKEPYYIKMFHYFVISQVEFISIQNPFDIPKQLALQLFKDDDNPLSITKLTDLFYNVEHIQFSNLSEKTMMTFCGQFCQSVIEYSVNYERNKFKKLKVIRLKSKNLSNSKASPLLKKCAEQYKSNGYCKNIHVEYIYEYELNHILQFTIGTVRDIKSTQYESKQSQEEEEEKELEEDAFTLILNVSND